MQPTACFVNADCYAVQGCDQDIAMMVNESSEASCGSLSTLCELVGQLAVCLGVILSDSTQLCLVTDNKHLYYNGVSFYMTEAG